MMWLFGTSPSGNIGVLEAGQAFGIANGLMEILMRYVWNVARTLAGD